MKYVKKTGKIFSYILVFFLLGIGIIYVFYNESVPTGQEGNKADALAKKMTQAIGGEKYANTNFLEWSFANGSHRYKWNKSMGLVTVKWDDYTAKLNLNNNSLGTITKENTKLTTKEKKELLQNALDYFNNDSFWLVAPFKVFDKGTKREIVTLENGEEALLVSYTIGGSTPGDSYLWLLQPNGTPKSYKMWVSIIPVGGIKASWEGWKRMKSGILLPSKHKIGPITLDMGTIKAY
ncbi:hypothetical protein CLV91_1893 [Maribacter vaceletii]|uniref:Uncharacterized protein n=1 Tax=Maribacter vaceletii TaxID=1206816 RepID=A0A495E8D3_9FLAO|nr:hypothetical protein [Maribacter vaceletii]RKR13178.1 hypothetical protein CLV91_1893 [Maribacter vaceletii]